jgi:hypothetical protein
MGSEIWVKERVDSDKQPRNQNSWKLGEEEKRVKYQIEKKKEREK